MKKQQKTANKIRYNLYIDKDLATSLEKRANKNGMAVSTYIRALLLQITNGNIEIA